MSDIEKTKTAAVHPAHVSTFAGLFHVAKNRLGNSQLQCSLQQTDVAEFLTAQASRPGVGEESTSAQLQIVCLERYFNGLVNDLPAVVNSPALLKRVNGWSKRPEVAAATGETRAKAAQQDGTNKLAQALADAENTSGKDSPEYAAAAAELMTYALSNLGA